MTHHFLTCGAHLHVFTDFVRHLRSHSVTVNQWCVRHAIHGSFTHTGDDLN